jgi:flagellum-specific ATP synthase
MSALGENALDRLARRVATARSDIGFVRISGKVTAITPGFLSVAGLSAFTRLGDRVAVETDKGVSLGEVIRVDAEGVTAKLYDQHAPAGIGARVFMASRHALAPCSAWKGRVVDALGRPIDGGGPLPAGPSARPIEGEPPHPLRRGRVAHPIRTGLRVLDLFTPICAGQRLGIFAGSGVGKSTLLGMLARAKGFDTIVIALVGERGREVREFLEDTLGAAARSAVTVVSTGDESPMMRRLAPKIAMSIAEFFRNQGEAVLLIVDSITRFAHALREVSLAAGEPPVARGYTPSVFSELPKLLERAGPGEDGCGSITGVFSVLVDGDDHNDPVADGIRGTLDGHIVLDRAIAGQGRFPAVDVLGSVSRLAQQVWTPDQHKLVARLRAMIARFEDTRDLRAMGGHQPGGDPELDHALAIVPKIYQALEQTPSAPLSTDAFRELAELISFKG